MTLGSIYLYMSLTSVLVFSAYHLPVLYNGNACYALQLSELCVSMLEG